MDLHIFANNQKFRKTTEIIILKTFKAYHTHCTVYCHGNDRLKRQKLKWKYQHSFMI